MDEYRKLSTEWSNKARKWESRQHKSELRRLSREESDSISGMSENLVIPADKWVLVSAVLLSDGWHALEGASFRLAEFMGSAGFAFQEACAEACFRTEGPLGSILAVRFPLH